MSGAEAAKNDTPDEDELNKAIEELRGVLKDEVGKAAPTSRTAGAPIEFGGNAVILDIPVEVQIVLGSSEMAVSELMTLQKGSTVALDRRIGEPVDLVVNGRKIARGEITVLESDPSRFGVKLTEIAPAKPGK